MNYPEFGIFWPQKPSTSTNNNQKNQKLQPNVQAYFPQTSPLLQQLTPPSFPVKQSQSERDQPRQNGSRPKSKEEEKDNIIQFGNPSSKTKISSSNTKQTFNNQQMRAQDQAAHLKHSNYTSTTAAASVSSYLPIHAVENFYYPMIREQ